MDYWKECISEALEDAGLKATDAQIDTVTSWVEGAYENYGQAMGYDVIPNPERMEIDGLRQELIAERDKDHCKEARERGDEWRRIAEQRLYVIEDLRRDLATVNQ